MFGKVLLFTPAMLLLAAFAVNASPLNCADMSPADCKKAFDMEMDKDAMEMFKEMAKMEMKKRMDLFAAVKNDMPADGMHAKMLMDAMDDMKAQMPKMDKMGDMNMEESKNAIQDAFMSMQPDFKNAQMQDSANAEKFNEMMEKHGYDMDMMEDDFAMMMKEFESVCMKMMDSLRPEDMKEYPEYMEMKDMLKSMMEASDNSEKYKMFMAMMKKMADTNEAPHMKAMMEAMSKKA